MLLELHIKNLAVVQAATLEFGNGLNVLTGSTGAGKSLILSAVNLLLGERASPRIIRRGAGVAVVEGKFRIPRTALPSAFPSVNGKSHATLKDHVVLRREVHKNGRSYAFIQGKPSTLKELHEVCVTLIEPHGQNEQLRLKDPQNHIVYLDALAGNANQREEFSQALGNFEAAWARLRDFDQRMLLLKEKRELFEHRMEEIDRARIEKGEKEALEASLRVLENAQRIFEALSGASSAVYDGETAAVTSIARAIKEILRVCSFDPKFNSFAEALEAAQITLEECAGEIRTYLGNLEFSPEKLEEMQERYAFLNGLERRYGKPLDKILEERQEWERELESLTFESEERETLNRNLDLKRKKLERIARKLTASRVRAAKTLDAQVTGDMENLMMPGALFRTAITEEEDPQSPLELDGKPVKLQSNGVDHVEFYVRTNRGEAEGRLSEIASTGEVSRIALALKKVTRAGAEAGTLVFDEIDVGVGADLGEVIAGELLALSKRYQIICITHMPQIAASGEAHIMVTKKSVGGRAIVQAVPVKGGERLREISRMLGGRKGSEKRLALAEEMLQKRSRKSTSTRVRP